MKWIISKSLTFTRCLCSIGTTIGGFSWSSKVTCITNISRFVQAFLCDFACRKTQLSSFDRKSIFSICRISLDILKYSWLIIFFTLKSKVSNLMKWLLPCINFHVMIYDKLVNWKLFLDRMSYRCKTKELWSVPFNSWKAEVIHHIGCTCENSVIAN